MPPFPKLPLCALVVAAFATVTEPHPSIAQGAREHPPIEEPAAVLLPKFDDMTQAPTTLKGRANLVFSTQGSLTGVGQWWETPTAQYPMRRPQMAAILDAAEVGPAGDDHAKHAHDHDHQEGSRITGSGALVASHAEVSGSGHVREKHGDHPSHPESDRSVRLKGQSVDVAQGSMTPGTSAPL